METTSVSILLFITANKLYTLQWRLLPFGCPNLSFYFVFGLNQKFSCPACILCLLCESDLVDLVTCGLHVGKNTNILLQQTTVLNDLSYCSNCTALKFALFSIYYLCFWGSQSQNYLKDIIHHQKLIALFKRALRVKTYVDDVILLRGRLMKLEATYTTWGKADVYNKDAFYYFNFFHSL